tara:strand:- start:79 stop:276 length:198 start_codon:yes stop_codon:yes gene_type:complete
MALEFLNEMKKENKEKRREQNKRYRQKNKEILNLKKQRMYYQLNLEKKLAKKQTELNNNHNLKVN